jgi:AraC-like DNA-binding protein
MSPKDFLTLQRRFEAKRMLLEDASSVSEICLAVGYESLGTFSTRFREATGLSPSEFRRQARRCHAFGEIWTYKFVPHCFVIGPHSSERSARNEKRLLLGPT